MLLLTPPGVGSCLGEVVARAVVQAIASRAASRTRLDWDDALMDCYL